MQLRLAELGDAEAIVNVVNAAFRKAESFLVDHDRVESEDVLQFFSKGSFLVADEPGLLLGCVYVEVRGDRAYLGLLSVDPNHQQAGLGSQLMTAAEQYCAKAGCRFMDLQIVSVRRELPSFYRRRGYVETGTAPFPANLNPRVACHFVKMSKPLI